MAFAILRKFTCLFIHTESLSIRLFVMHFDRHAERFEFNQFYALDIVVCFGLSKKIPHSNHETWGIKPN